MRGIDLNSNSAGEIGLENLYFLSLNDLLRGEGENGEYTGVSEFVLFSTYVKKKYYF